jgi:hypothetical protein
MIRITKGLRPVTRVTREEKQMAKYTVDELMKRAFDVPRDPRSAEYKAGVRSILTLRLGGVAKPFPYRLGTVEADAYLAGQDEGNRIWRTLQDDGEV